MRTRLLAENPEAITFTLKVEATAKEFEALRDALHKAPHITEVYVLRQQLDDLLAQARKIFWSKDSAEILAEPDAPQTGPQQIGTFMGATLYVDGGVPDRDFIVRQLTDRIRST